MLAHEYIEAVLWFDLPKQTDWRVATSPAAECAIADGVARMQGRNTPIPVPAPAPGMRAPR